MKVSVTWMDSEWLIVLAPGARLAWIQLLAYVKTAGVDGKAKAKSASVFARQNYIGEEDVEQMLRAAKNDGALEIKDGEWIVTNWKTYQGDSTNAQRQAKWRESNTRNALRNTERESESDIRVRDIPPKSPKSKKPTVEQIAAYMEEQGWRHPEESAQEFYDSNEAKGWVVGKLHTPMKDWTAVVRTWARHDPSRLRPKPLTDEQVRKMMA